MDILHPNMDILHPNMDIQPNFQRMSEAFATASQEIARVSNVPSFDNGQRILKAVEALTRTVESLRSDVRTDITSLRTDVSNLRTDVTDLRTDMNGGFELLELRMNAEAINTTARLHNSHITSRETSLHALRDRRNMAIDGFPSNISELMRLTGPALSNLLESYGLFTDGNVEGKKRRLKQFIGIVIDI